jgi:uncharacterized protein YigE (DUF2233 family)
MFYKLISFLFVLVYACASGTSPTSKNTFEAFQLSYRGHSFDVVQIDPSAIQIDFFLENSNGIKYRSFKNLKTDLEANGQSLRFAMNGGMYLKDGSPQGLYIEKGKLIKPLDTIQNAFGNFYLQPNGIFYVQDKKGYVLSTSQYLATSPIPNYATQSGPMLVIENKIHPSFVEGSNNLNIRNGVGIDKEGKVVFVISNEALNLYDFAMLFKEKLSCKNALYLDGFVSKSYIPDLNRNDLGGNFGVIIGVSQANGEK